MLARLLLRLLLAGASSLAAAATTVQPLTPLNSSVAAGETQVFAARFFDALGRPAAGEPARFFNDACGLFDNNAITYDTVTDSTGVARATFRASGSGVVCHVEVGAGVHTRFLVITYSPSLVNVMGTMLPSEPRPGDPFIVRVAAKYGAYDTYNVDLSARVIPGTASATIDRAGGNTGQEGFVDFRVTPDGRLGDYRLEFAFRDRVRRLAMRAPDPPWQDMWWGGEAQSGWGISLVQRGDALFSVIYAYDAGGKPTWYMMPGGTWDAGHTAYSGPLYKPRGAPVYAYDPSRLEVGEPVGNATLYMADVGHVTLDYAIAGVSGRKSLVRHEFGTPDSVATPAPFGGMWWGGDDQGGWGIAMLQQYRTLFVVWYTYDERGAPTWYVMPSGVWLDARTYRGAIYRTSSSPWLGGAYDASKFRSGSVGNFTLRFDGGEAATLEYDMPSGCAAFGEPAPGLSACTSTAIRGTLPLRRFAF